MQLSLPKFWLLYGGTLLYLLASQPTTAQIVPDNTLPNNSIVPPNCINCEITGGTTAGNNLFHSFEQFSVTEGGIAYFNNATTVENIISRVTGKSRSEINGLIRANGTANLFLINPNGVIFGRNASLNIGGSFLATSAERIVFADGIQFNAVNPQTPPLLTVSVPIGLQFGQTPGEIRNESISQIFDDQGTPNSVGLRVAPGRTLALVGGQVNLSGGILTASGGRIELGSIAGNGLVRLTPLTPTNQGWVIDYDGIQNFENISLSNKAVVDTSGARSGDIQIQGRRVTLTGESFVYSDAQESQAGNLAVNASEQLELMGSYPTGLFNIVRGNATGEGRSLTIETGKLLIQGGAHVTTSNFGINQGVDLRVNASESVELENNTPDGNSPSSPTGLVTRVERGATGNGGTLTIETRRLIVRNGAQVVTYTEGAGRVGNLRVSASESVELLGTTQIFESPNGLITLPAGLFTLASQGTTGDGGELRIDTGRLTVSGGAQISTATRTRSNGGTLIVNASDSIQLSGTSPLAIASPLDQYRSGIFVSAESGARGNVGNLNVTTRLLTVEDGARISADNLGSDNTGGVANLNVSQLIIRNGGQVRSGSFDAGAGGTLNVNATESVQVIGSTIIGSRTVPSELFTEAQSSGNAGNLNINTDNLSVRDGARVTLSSIGTGQAGNLEVQARAIELDNKGTITTTTDVGRGGDIFLLNLDSLVMRRNSNISTRSGDENELGQGGNITIYTGVLAGLENSDINANAFGGSGGQISINAQAIFGIQAGTVENPTTSDITARSELRPNLSGSITINTPDVDPSSGLIQLPENFVDASSLVDRRCSASNRASSFVVTGSGGLPASPIAVLSGDAIDVNWVALPEQNSRGLQEQKSKRAGDNFIVGDRIIEAQGWVKGPNGEVILTATPPTVTPHNSWQRPIDCP